MSLFDLKRPKVTTIRLKRNAVNIDKGSYKVQSGAISLLTSDIRGNVAVVGTYYKDDVFLVPDNHALRAMSEAVVLEKAEENSVSLEKQLCDVYIGVLNDRNYSVKQRILELLRKFTYHRVSGVQISNVALIIGCSREIAGKRIKELMQEKKVQRTGVFTWETV